MTQILGEITSIATQSFVDHKIRHVIGVVGTGAGTIEATKDQIAAESAKAAEIISLIPDWLPLGEIVAIGSFALVCITFYKTWIEVGNLRLDRKHKQMKISAMDRRVDP
jgi:hypothetical protein